MATASVGTQPRTRIISEHNAAPDKRTLFSAVREAWELILGAQVVVQMQTLASGDFPPLHGACNLAVRVASLLSANLELQPITLNLPRRYAKVLLNCDHREIHNAIDFGEPTVYVFKPRSLAVSDRALARFIDLAYGESVFRKLNAGAVARLKQECPPAHQANVASYFARHLSAWGRKDTTWQRDQVAAHGGPARTFIDVADDARRLYHGK